MIIIYLVKGTSGEWDNNVHWNSKTFISKLDAETYLAKTQDLVNRLWDDICCAGQPEVPISELTETTEKSISELSIVDSKHCWEGYDSIKYELEEIELAEPSEN